MSVMAGFAILITEAVVSFYKKVHAINFGVYGSTMVGKTTLSHQLRTRGEVQQINRRTVGLERASRKVIKFDGESHFRYFLFDLNYPLRCNVSDSGNVA